MINFHDNDDWGSDDDLDNLYDDNLDDDYDYGGISDEK